MITHMTDIVAASDTNSAETIEIIRFIRFINLKALPQGIVNSNYLSL